MTRGRPATPPGSFGKVTTQPLQSGLVQASTRLRLFNGQTKRIRASGRTKTAAINNLKAKCSNRLGAVDTPDLHGGSPLSALLDHWLEVKEVRTQSADRYRTVINKHIVPDFGDLRLNEIRPAYLNAYIKGCTPGVAHGVDTVLKGAFKLAVQYGLIPTSPMQAVDPVAGVKKKVEALSVQEIEEFRTKIADSGDSLVMDVTDLCLATGMRLGEALAIRWADLDLDVDPPLLQISGTLVYANGRGYFRQDVGKSEAANRLLQLPALAVAMLLRRRATYGAFEMVFPSSAGTYTTESNFNKRFREARGDRFGWVTTHILRKTFTSIVADSIGPHKAADALGHANSVLTETTYYQRSRQGVPIAAAIDDAIPVSKKCPNIRRN